MGAAASWEDVKRYDVKKVGCVLELYGMHNQKEEFAKQKVNGRLFLAMDEDEARGMGIENTLHLEILSLLKQQLYTRGGRVIKQVITPYPAPPPKPYYVGVVRRELVVRWNEEQARITCHAQTHTHSPACTPNVSVANISVVAALLCRRCKPSSSSTI
jgi:hypothetical protein